MTFKNVNDNVIDGDVFLKHNRLYQKEMTFQWCYWRCISMVIAQMNKRMIKMNIS